MYKVTLTSSEKSLLSSKISKTSNTWLLKRYQCIMMRSDNLGNQQISSYLEVDVNTLTNWVKMYLEGGFSKLETFNLSARRQSKLESLKEEIQKKVLDEDSVISTMSQLSSWLKKKHNIYIEESWLRRWCKKNSISLLKRQG